MNILICRWERDEMSGRLVGSLLADRWCYGAVTSTRLNGAC
jgi:hypothetical protein